MTISPTSACNPARNFLPSTRILRWHRLRLNHFLRRSARLIEDQPFAVRNNHAAQDEHPLVDDSHLERLIGSRREQAEIFLRGLYRGLGGPQRCRVGGQLFQKLAQAQIGVRFGGGAVGGGDQIKPADAAEKCWPIPRRQEGPRLFPALIARQRQLIEIGAHLPIRKTKRDRKRHRTDMHGPGVRLVRQRPAIVITIARIRRIELRTGWTQAGHENLEIAIVLRLDIMFPPCAESDLLAAACGFALALRMSARNRKRQNWLPARSCFA